MGTRLARLEGYPYVAARSEWGKVLGAAFSLVPYAVYPLTHAMRIFGLRLWWVHPNRELIRLFRRTHNNRAMAGHLGLEVAQEYFRRDGVELYQLGTSCCASVTCPTCEYPAARFLCAPRPITDTTRWQCARCSRIFFKMKLDRHSSHIARVITSLLFIPNSTMYQVILKNVFNKALFLAASAKSPMDHIREIAAYNILIRTPPNVDHMRLCDLRANGLADDPVFLKEWPEHVYEETFTLGAAIRNLAWLERVIAEGPLEELPPPQVDVQTGKPKIECPREW